MEPIVSRGQKMKEYLVTMDSADWHNIFIVSAPNAKDAIDQVFVQYFEPENTKLKEENKKCGEQINHIYTKSDLKTKSIGSLHSREGKIILVN